MENIESHQLDENLNNITANFVDIHEIFNKLGNIFNVLIFLSPCQLP
jgi:hypothetical protein